jgi:peptide/nickel transport system substrate-binding protein
VGSISSSFTRRLSALALGLGLIVAACAAPQATPTPTAAGPTEPPSETATPAEPTATGGEPTDAPTDAPTEPPVLTGGTVRIGWGGSPDDLNPGNGVLSEDYTLYELIYETPIAITSGGDFVPELASDWSVSDDELTWTLNIVEGATFHDGTPLTAEDIAFSILLYQATDDFPFLPSYTDGFVSVEATDPTTLVITTEEPVGNFESRLLFMYVLPMHIWEGIEDPVAFDNADMIGSGPFSLSAYEQGTSVTLEAVKDHWNTPPNIDRVIFQTFANPDARITALRNGDVDMITEFPATAFPALQGDANIDVLIANSIAPGLNDIIFNVIEPENCPPDDGVCSGHPALRDVEVRRALAEATDKQALIDVALLGLGEPGLSLVPPGLGDFYAAEVQDYAFDVAAANARLDAAGYADTTGDGIRECLADQDCPTGDLTFRLNLPSDSDTGPREAEMIAAMWRQVGVNTQVQVLDTDALTSICCPSFDFDVIMWGWGVDPDPAFLLGVTLCDEIPSGFSETGYCNPAYDELYAQQNVETDHDARVALIHQMQQILIDDLPYIITYYDQTMEAARRDTFIGWPFDNPTLGWESPESLANIRPAQ